VKREVFAPCEDDLAVDVAKRLGAKLETVAVTPENRKVDWMLVQPSSILDSLIDGKADALEGRFRP
jgi:ABC-type amino acid transport substrate-binding protein